MAQPCGFTEMVKISEKFKVGDLVRATYGSNKLFVVISEETARKRGVHAPYAPSYSRMSSATVHLYDISRARYCWDTDVNYYKVDSHDIIERSP